MTEGELTTRVIAEHPPIEVIDRRDRHTRVYEIAREVETKLPDGSTTVDTVKSYIIEKANNLCYPDEWGSFVPSIAEFEAVPGGFVADRNNFGLAVGETLGEGLVAHIEGVPVTMRPAYLVLFDGTRSLTLAKADPSALGKLDDQDPSVVRFPRAFGDLADLEYIVRKGGYHQNVVIHRPIAFPAGFDPEDSQVLVYSEMNYDDLVANRSVKATDVDGEINLSSLNSASMVTDLEIDFQIVPGEGKNVHLFSLGESAVWDSPADPQEVKRTVAQKQFFRSEAGVTYLVERINHSFLSEARYPVVLDYVLKTGSMTEDDTWTPPNTYYISDDLTVSGATLTIRPGTTVKYEDGTSAFLKIQSSGCIKAEGTAYDYITFTSKKDDSSGEDLTDTSTSGSRGDYQYGIYMAWSASTRCVIKYCKIGYAYYSILNYINSSSLAPIEDNIIAHCYYGVYLYRPADVKNNLIFDCSTRGIYGVYGGSPAYTGLISNNTIDSPTYGIYCYSSSLTAKYNFLSNCTYGARKVYGTLELDFNGYYSNTYDVYGCSKGNNWVNVTSDPYDTSPVGDFYLKEEGFDQLKNKPNEDPDMGFSGDLYTTQKPAIAPTTINGDYTVDKVEHETTTYFVDIGYHHNRVDWLLDNSNTTVTNGTLTINNGTVVAIRGHYALKISTNGTLVCDSAPLENGYNVIARATSVSARIESPAGRHMTGGYVWLTPSSTVNSSIKFTRFRWLSYGLYPAKSLATGHEIRDNWFEFNYYGCIPVDSTNTFKNNLYYGNLYGLKANLFTTMSYNNTFDSNDVGLWLARAWQLENAHVMDNLFTNNGEGIRRTGPSGGLTNNYNAFYGNTHNIYDYDLSQELDIGPQSRNLVSSPYHDEKTGPDAGWYLKQEAGEGENPDEVLAVDYGSQSASMAGLDEKTTSVYLKPDTGVVDIGSHHPLDWNRDSDSDTMPDWWENLHGLNPLDPGDASSDADDDSLDASQEYQAGTDPNERDSDHDSVPDAEDPNPAGRTDTDGDGMTDDWETYYLGSTSQGPDGDPDSDGLTNWEEWNLDTDPSNPDTDSDGIADGYDKDPNGPKLTIVSLTPPKTASDDPEDPAYVSSTPLFRLEGIADARLRNVEVFVNNRDGSSPGYAALIEPSKFEMKHVPLGGEGKYDIMVKAYDFDDNVAYAFTQVEVSYSAPPGEAWIKVREAVEESRAATLRADYRIPDGASPVAGYINGKPANVSGTTTGTVSLTNLPLGRGANAITARLIYTYGGPQYQITDTGTVYFHVDSPAYDQWYSSDAGTLHRSEEQYRDSDWYYDTCADPGGYFHIPTRECDPPYPYGDCRTRITSPASHPDCGIWFYQDQPNVGRVALLHREIHWCHDELDETVFTEKEVQTSLFRTRPVVGVPNYDYLVYLQNVSLFPWVEQPTPPNYILPGYTLDGKPLICVSHSKYVVRLPLTPASEYCPVLGAPETQGPPEGQYYQKGRRLIGDVNVKPYYIVLSLQTGQGEDLYYIDWEDVSIGEPIIKGEWVWVNAVPTYSPDGCSEIILWEHRLPSGAWIEESPPFIPQETGQHAIRARYFPEGDECGLSPAEDTVTFTVVDPPGIELLSFAPKETLLIGERMPLVGRVININAEGEPESMVIDPHVEWLIVEGEGVAETHNWRQLWRESPPPGPGHTEWWFTGTLAGVSEGGVKVKAVVTYLTPGYPIPQIHILTGPEHEVEVRGFVDVRLDNVGEWGEEDPGAFMAKDGVEELRLRTCTAGDVVLFWNSDKIGLYTDAACQAEDKVVEDDGSVEGSRRATFSPEYPTWPDVDIWGARFRTEELWTKGLETSTVLRDIHLTLSPVSAKAATDVMNLTIVEVEIVIHKEPGFHTKQIENGILEIRLYRAHIYGESKPSGADISNYRLQQNAYISSIDAEWTPHSHTMEPDGDLINIPADEGYYDTTLGPTGPGGYFSLPSYRSFDWTIKVFIMENPTNSKTWGYDWSWDEDTQELTAHDKGP